MKKDKSCIIDISNYMSKVLAFVACALIFMTGCSDDLNVDTNIPEGEKKVPGITIRIPNIQGNAFASSRSDEKVSATEKETEINDLWLIVCWDDGSKIIHLLDKKNNLINSSLSQTEEYTTFTIEDHQLTPGNYNVYVLGNVNPYLSEQDKLTENKNLNNESVRNLVLNFNDLISGESTQLTPGYLPMACLTEDLTQTDGGNSIESDGSISYEKGDVLEVYADMKFLCSKVRYTILFDNNPGGFSEAFEDNLVDFNTDKAKAGNLRNSTNVVYTSEPASFNKSSHLLNEKLSIGLNRKNFPEEESYPNYEGDSYVTSSDLQPYSGNNWENEHRRAWQGTIYLPENLQPTSVSGDVSLESAESGNGTFLHFPATIGETGKNYVTLINKEKGIARAKFYDVVAKVQKPDDPDMSISVSVKDWTLQTLQYELMGPTELIVETTEIGNVKSGEWYEFWYESNIAPQDINFDYPPFEWSDNNGYHKVNFYNAEVKKMGDNYNLDARGRYIIRFKINPEIPFSQLDLLSKSGNQNNYEFLEILAGNLHKKIKIGLEEFKPYLSITPQTIIIDVKEYISAGMDSDQIEIEFETNVQEGKLSIDGNGLNLLHTAKGDLELQINPIGNLTWENNVLSSKVGKLVLNIDKLFDGLDFWKSSETFILSFSLSGTDLADFQKYPETSSKTVTIEIKPYTTFYAFVFNGM